MSFATRRRAPTKREWTQKEAHVLKVYKDIHQGQASEIIAAAGRSKVEMLRKLPRFPEMNTRMMLRALEVLQNITNKETLRDGDYTQLKTLVGDWRFGKDYPLEQTNSLKAMLLRYCLAVMQVNEETLELSPGPIESVENVEPVENVESPVGSEGEEPS